MVGIKSLVVYNDIHAWNVINLNNTWYHIDMANTKAETLSVNNIGKCLKSDKQLQKNKLYRDNDCQVKCSENPSKDLITQINKTARKVKNNTPKMQKQRKSFREIFRKIFGKKEQTLSLPETVEEKEQEQIINMVDCAPIGLVENDILWEIKTWDKDDVHNKINISYVSLPRIGSPQDICSKNPEAFSKLYTALVNDAKGEYLGKICYDKEKNTFLGLSPTAKEMLNVNDIATKLIKDRNKVVETTRKENMEKNGNTKPDVERQ